MNYIIGVDPAFTPSYEVLSFGGIPFISDPLCPKTISVQVRFPRSKRSRIRKKWRKNPANWAEQSVLFVMHKGRAMTHPHNYAVIRNFVLPEVHHGNSINKPG